MNIISIKELDIPDVCVIEFSRFCDNRGYFTEHFRKSDFKILNFFHSSIHWVQMNESFSKKGTIRGLHFQWNPFMGKLVRTLHGEMVDLFLDIRKGSPTFGKIAAYHMSSHTTDDRGEWIWIPPGFAHGNFFLQDTVIEYLCTGEYNKDCEAGISPLAQDLDWSLCDTSLSGYFNDCVSDSIISDKDKDALTLAEWTRDPRSDNFLYSG